MILDVADCVLVGPALPEPFVLGELAACLTRMGLLKPAHACERGWSAVRRQLRTLGAGGKLHVHNHVVAPLADVLGYAAPARHEDVVTREGSEDGGWLLAARAVQLRAWSVDADTDLDAPHRSGRAYRFSPTRSAQRVLLARGEHAGLLTNGHELRLLLCDPSRADSHMTIALNGAAGWRARALAPDSYRVLLALASPKGIAALPAVLEAARLSQTRVTKELRQQARSAIEGFVQAVLDHPANVALHSHDRDALAAMLWQEALILVYRLLFILKLESAADSARAFSFAATSLWRGSLSPNVALGPLVRRHIDLGQETGTMIEHGLRAVFAAFRDGLSCSELSIAPLGGALFGAGTTKLLDDLVWGDRAAALLLDRLLWTMGKGRGRERVHYGALDVEDLGRIYESLLELEPGLASEPMVRLRRAALEVVVPAANAARAHGPRITPVERIEAGRFYLRVGLGRKTTGSYYTPHAFVRFLLRETLAPRLAELSPDSDPDPAAILSLKLVDPAAGSGHFLVEACRQLGEALYAACRLCDEQASALETEAANAGGVERAATLRGRIAALPDPDRSLLAYLPSRAKEGGESGVSQSRALAICRRLVAVHCLYGIDRNPLAVELAKLSLWLESYAEGLPLTFLDHRLVVGDSLTAPFAAQLAALPVGGGALDPLLARGVAARLDAARAAALRAVDALEATVGRDAADVVLKQQAKIRLDATLAPLRELARAWAGAVMLATREADDEWLALARKVAEAGTWPGHLTPRQVLLLQAGGEALPWDLMFPEVFRHGGFDIVVGNPPWDIVQQNAAEFLAAYDLSVLDAPTTRAAHDAQARVLADPVVAAAFDRYQQGFAACHRAVARLYHHQKVVVGGEPTGGKLDLYRVFAERVLQLLGPHGAVGLVVPSGFHAAEGATGIRRLYLQQTAVDWCLSFENRHRLFDIHTRVKFALVVTRRPGPTRAMRCGFYLTDPQQMEDASRLMTYEPDFIATSGGSHATLLELRGAADLAIARRMFRSPRTFADWIAARGIALSREANMTDDAARFIPAARMRPGDFALHEGKTIHQFTDQWSAPRYAIRAAALSDRPQFLANARYFRAACREIASATNERTAIAAMLPPGVICGHTLNVERTPARRSNASALILVGLMNSFAFDWLLRQKAASHVSLYLLADLACPALSADAERFIAHATLRLCCNHAGFAPLWREQFGGRPRAFPLIANETARRRLHATIDAVVAAAYGLRRDDYRHVLAGFSHKSSSRMPKACLAAFDALAAQGLGAFCRHHDPYHDVPLAGTNARLAAPSSALRAGERTDADQCHVPRVVHAGGRRAGGNAAHRPQ